MTRYPGCAECGNSFVYLFLYRILMPAGEFEMLGLLNEDISDLTASDSFLFERKEKIVWRSIRSNEHVASFVAATCRRETQSP